MVDKDLELALKLQKEFDEEYARSLSEGDVSKTKSAGKSAASTSINDIDEDFRLALRLQEELNGKTAAAPLFTGSSNKLSDNSMELCDPNPDALALFVEFNRRFFSGKLASVEVIWSTKMTLCAGLCEYHGSRSGMCRIKLSEPLLKFRPRKDLLETLLHEMIHAYLFLTKNNRDRDGHGPEFQKHMCRINKETGLNISIYHSFHNEVASYQKHWWLCSGPCRDRPPYFGYVKRSMNRAPSANDHWWAEHRMTCGGTFQKMKEPENFGVKKRKQDGEQDNRQNAKLIKLDSYFTPTGKKLSSISGNSTWTVPTTSSLKSNNSINTLSSMSGLTKVEPKEAKNWGKGYALNDKSSMTTWISNSNIVSHFDPVNSSSARLDKTKKKDSAEANLSFIWNRNGHRERSREWPKPFPSNRKFTSLEEGMHQLRKSDLQVGETIEIPGFVSVSSPNHPNALKKLGDEDSGLSKGKL